MASAKVVYLDEYRKARKHRNLFEMIEGHLAEAGLLGKCSSAGSIGPDKSEGRRHVSQADKGDQEKFSSKCSSAIELPEG